MIVDEQASISSFNFFSILNHLDLGIGCLLLRKLVQIGQGHPVTLNYIANPL
jgi:hypothetical protein